MKKLIKDFTYLIVLSIMMVPSLLYSQDEPLIYDQGSSYTGPYEASGRINVPTGNTEPFLIEGKIFKDLNTVAINSWRGTDVTIRNCRFENIDASRVIFSERGNNFIIENCVFINTKTILYADKPESNVKFEHNDIKNIQGGAIGIHFVNGNGPGFSISHNAIENILDESNTQASIVTQNSKGTLESPIIINNNWIRGGVQNGMVIGSGGGGFQVIENNRLFNAGRNGITLGGAANDLTFRNNTLFGEPRQYSNWGFDFRNGSAYNIVVENNHINWAAEDGTFQTAQFDDNMKAVVPNWEEVDVRDPKIDDWILPEVILGKIDPFDPNPPIIPTPDIKIYADEFNRISVKMFQFPVAEASIEIFDSGNQKVIGIQLTRFRTLVDRLLAPGKYEVKVNYPALETFETQTIIID